MSVCGADDLCVRWRCNVAIRSVNFDGRISSSAKISIYTY